MAKNVVSKIAASGYLLIPAGTVKIGVGNCTQQVDSNSGVIRYVPASGGGNGGIGPYVSFSWAEEGTGRTIDIIRRVSSETPVIVAHGFVHIPDIRDGGIQRDVLKKEAASGVVKKSLKGKKSKGNKQSL